LLDEHIKKCKAATNKPFGVNVPLLYSGVEKQIEVIVSNGVEIVITSAGNPAIYTPFLKQRGKKVIHVVSSSRFAKKAESSGCDAVIAEGFEAGGHNGREETTTMVLLPLVCESVQIPVIAAGGIASGRQMLAAMVLGAEGVQIGSRFAASEESSLHPDFKNAIINSKEGDTILTLKEITPVRLLKNEFYSEIIAAEKNRATVDQLKALLGKGRAKKGMLEGDLKNGELEIGQVSALLRKILPAKEIIENVWLEFNEALKKPLK